MNIDGRKTKGHIEAGLAFEAVANRKYAYFAKLARELGDQELAEFFDNIAKEESAHAFAYLTLMYPPGSLSAVDLLRLARDNERSETLHKYPEYAEIAKAERASATTEEARDLLLQAARRFEAVAEREDSHVERIEEMLRRRASR